MKKLLYIGHAYHNKTKSSNFIQELLAERYEITKFDFDPYSESFDKFKELNGKIFDNVILWQIMPEISRIKKYISFNKISFFPMYDATPRLTDPIWSEYRDCNIICFSKTLYEECKSYGLSTFYIQYFPKPLEITNLGDKNSVFLWQRVKQINSNTVAKILDIDKISKYYLHNAPDPLHEFIKPPVGLMKKTEITTWFDTRNDLINHIQKSAIYIAPRHLEGIGMSFLEAMAMGRCVIAPNNPTMNEYIENGKNGYLYNLRKPKKISLKNIEQIQRNTIEYVNEGYKKWNKNKYNIFDWIEVDSKLNSNIRLMDSKLLIKTPKKIQFKLNLTIVKKLTTEKYKKFYLFGFLPIKIKKFFK